MIYVDTSVVVALLTPERSTGAVMAWYAGLKDVPVSSDWLMTEFSSALSIKVRSGRLSANDARVVRKEFNRLSESGLRLASVSRAAFESAAGMAQAYRHGLRAGDALHIAVAREAGAATIATLDETMARNARRLKFTTVRF